MKGAQAADLQAGRKRGGLRRGDSGSVGLGDGLVVVVGIEDWKK